MESFEYHKTDNYRERAKEKREEESDENWIKSKTKKLEKLGDLALDNTNLFRKHILTCFLYAFFNGYLYQKIECGLDLLLKMATKSQFNCIAGAILSFSSRNTAFEGHAF